MLRQGVAKVVIISFAAENLEFTTDNTNWGCPRSEPPPNVNTL